MTQRITSRQGARRTEPGQDAAPKDQRNDELDADVACCLAEIDSALEQAESERDRALREFRELRARDEGDEYVGEELCVWEARYAHLQLTIGYSCCLGLYVYDKDGEHVA